MNFSVITPSFKNSEHLKLCVSSVADQEVNVQHLVQDAGSTDGTLDWLLKDDRVEACVEQDQGMYDAINRGLKRATGEILAHLNCDEQYLPGALKAVETYFQNHPGIDIVFGDAVVVDLQGNYLFHRKSQIPLRWHTRICSLSTLTCATFFRRKVIDDYGLFFNNQYKFMGDGEWMTRALKAKIPMGVLRQFTSTFAQTGANLSLDPNARKEWSNYLQGEPTWLKKSRPAILLYHRLRRLAGGVYSQKPFSFSAYRLNNPVERVTQEVRQPTARWKW